MPKLLPQTERIRAKRFIKALEKTGSPMKAAMEVLDIGSKGAKDLNNSASSAGSQMLRRIKPTMLEALENQGVTPEKIAKKIDSNLDNGDPNIVDKAIDKSLKVGVGGGYAAEKHQSLNVNINSTPAELDKFKKLREEYEKKVLEA